MAGNVTKNIYFHEMYFLKGNKPVEPKSVYKLIDSLPFKSGDGGRYFDLEDGNKRSMIIEPGSLEDTSTIISAKFGNRRDNNWPYTDKNGTIGPLELPSDTGLYEPAHFVLFPGNVLGFEYNFHGPRPSSIRNYILSKARPLIDEVVISSLFRQDVRETLAKMKQIHAVRLKIASNVIDETEKDLGSLYQAYSIVANETEADYVDIYFRTRSSKHGLNLPFRSRIADMLSKPDIVPGIKTFGVKSDGEWFDLLSQCIISKKQVMKEDDRHNVVNSADMFNAIESAYNAMKVDIENAKKGVPTNRELKRKNKNKSNKINDNGEKAP